MPDALPGPIEPPHVLLVGLDLLTLSGLASLFSNSGITVAEVQTNSQTLDRIAAEDVDLLILNQAFSDRNGVDLLREVRMKSEIPIIVVGDRPDNTDVVLYLEMGADDVLSVTTDRKVLVSKVRALLRRSRTVRPHKANGLLLAPGLKESRTRSVAKAYLFENWRYETETGRLKAPSAALVNLTGTQREILTILLSHAPDTVRREEILSLLPGRKKTPSVRAIDGFVTKLRRRLEAHDPNTDFIRAAMNEGYFFALPVATEAPKQ